MGCKSVFPDLQPFYFIHKSHPPQVITPIMSTLDQFDAALALCRDIFSKKLKDYGASWRIMRPRSITDQLYIKAKRIRTLEEGEALVNEGVFGEFMAIVNYGIVGLIQLEAGYADEVDMDADTALALYDKWVAETRRLLAAKTHDYGDAWRGMRVNSYTDFILTKLQRVKEIETNQGRTIVSEGIDANYMDIINYAIFAIIKLTESGEKCC